MQQVSTPEARAEYKATMLAFAAEELRQARGWSYAELAQRMGVSRAYAHKVLTGAGNSTLVSLCKLAAALDCELEIKLTPRVAAPESAVQPVPQDELDRAPAPAKPASKKGRQG